MQPIQLTFILLLLIFFFYLFIYSCIELCIVLYCIVLYCYYNDGNVNTDGKVEPLGHGLGSQYLSLLIFLP